MCPETEKPAKAQSEFSLPICIRWDPSAGRKDCDPKSQKRPCLHGDGMPGAQQGMGVGRRGVSMATTLCGTFTRCTDPGSESSLKESTSLLRPSCLPAIDSCYSYSLLFLPSITDQELVSDVPLPWQMEKPVSVWLKSWIWHLVAFTLASDCMVQSGNCFSGVSRLPLITTLAFASLPR